MQIPVILTALLGLAAASPAQELPSVEKRCTAVGQNCGQAQVCCPGSACSYQNYRCTAYGTAGQYCGNAVPCAAGLGCSTSGYCTPYGKAGQYCGNGVPCEAGLNCNWKAVCV
ncbi:hypothetical protein ISF_09457 [Cordyceps fumosorosea ARSEF 2679]|uniref:Uncharacterized protein n=1 Tax=Cordyceps fumosorosea (strain ARSEF 2679) TaxID=1081104 RepID=A0A167I8M0_CORFA|nr:hypothetical protein ISF_09457 [Cordyceps fumosorosea ARSEF 2679]OAA48791.1 hypothetical protein ISF_09457 [Cordyceps fumosorosea ARSEF 2679]